MQLKKPAKVSKSANLSTLLSNPIDASPSAKSSGSLSSQKSSTSQKSSSSQKSKESIPSSVPSQDSDVLCNMCGESDVPEHLQGCAQCGSLVHLTCSFTPKQQNATAMIAAREKAWKTGNVFCTFKCHAAQYPFFILFFLKKFFLISFSLFYFFFFFLSYSFLNLLFLIYILFIFFDFL